MQAQNMDSASTDALMQHIAAIAAMQNLNRMNALQTLAPTTDATGKNGRNTNVLAGQISGLSGSMNVAVQKRGYYGRHGGYGGHYGGWGRGGWGHGGYGGHYGGWGHRGGYCTLPIRCPADSRKNLWAIFLQNFARIDEWIEEFAPMNGRNETESTKRHYVTTYINGHSDVVMGVAVTNSDAIFEKLKFLQNSIGGVPSPFDCFLANRGLKTLRLRMRQHQENALHIATALEKSPYVDRVIYPGLSSHPQHELAKRQCGGFSGMVSFRLKNPSLAKYNAFLAAARLFSLAESLGCVESLAELPAVMTHASLTPEARVALGVDEGLIRLSIGVENKNDLVKDLTQALEKGSKVSSKL